MPSSRDQRRERPLAEQHEQHEQHEQWIVHLRGQVVSRRTLLGGAVGTAAGSLLLGSGRWADSAIAATLAGTGAIAGGFVVNGRHLSFGADPATEMWAGGQLLNISTCNAVPPCAEIRELLTHVPVWDGKPGALKASRTLNADQFFVHGRMAHPSPGTQYHYRFRYTAGREVGATPRRHVHHRPAQHPGADGRAVHLHGLRRRGHSRPVPGPGPLAAARIGLGHVPHRGQHHLGGDPGDHPVRNLSNGTPSRFTCWPGTCAKPRPRATSSPSSIPTARTESSRPLATPRSRRAAAAAGTTTTRGSGRAGSR